jgi:tetratricopeptide (TPR) repeat protein
MGNTLQYIPGFNDPKTQNIKHKDNYEPFINNNYEPESHNNNNNNEPLTNSQYKIKKYNFFEPGFINQPSITNNNNNNNIEFTLTSKSSLLEHANYYYYKVYDYKNALIYYTKIITLQHSLECDIHYNRIRCLLKLNRIDEALSAFETFDNMVVDHNLKMDICLNKALFYYDIREFNKAIVELDKVIKRSHEQSQKDSALYCKGCVLVTKGDKEEALNQFEEIIKNDKWNINCHVKKAILLHQLNKDNETMEEIKIIEEIIEKNEKDIWEYNYDEVKKNCKLLKFLIGSKKNDNK